MNRIDTWVGAADNQRTQRREHWEAGDEAARGEIVVPLYENINHTHGRTPYPYRDQLPWTPDESRFTRLRQRTNRGCNIDVTSRSRGASALLWGFMNERRFQKRDPADPFARIFLRPHATLEGATIN